MSAAAGKRAGARPAEPRRRSRVAVCPGSFDPVHNGHLDIVLRCRPLFDRVVVAVLENDAKKPLFSVRERVAMVREQLREQPDCEVKSFSGLLVEFMRREGACAIVRGLRAISDFEYEFQMALMNRRLDNQVETVFMMPRGAYSYLSSRLVKEVFFLGGDLRGLVPDEVLERMAAKRRRTGKRQEP